MKANLHIKKAGWLLLMAGLLMSFTFTDPFSSVKTALQKGDVASLSQYFDSMIELSLAGKSNSYSKSQASVILKDFFSRHQVKEFKIIHKGKSDKGSSFGIGNLETSKGDYRVTFFFRQKGKNMVLQELRFQESNQ